MNKRKKLERLALELCLELTILLFRAFCVSLKLFYVLLDMEVPPPQVAPIRGNLTYGDASLVEGTLLTLKFPDGTTANTTSAKADGTFEFDPKMALGEYTLEAHKDLPTGFLKFAIPVAISLGSEGAVLVDLPLVKAHHHRREGHANI